MSYLNKLPDSVREAPGLEWAVMKKLPLTLGLGTLCPLVMSLANRFFTGGRDGYPDRQTHQERRYPGHRNCSDSLDGCSDGCYRLFCGGDDEGSRLCRRRL